jgi:oligosaccharide repeat unit polymerase
MSGCVRLAVAILTLGAAIFWLGADGALGGSGLTLAALVGLLVLVIAIAAAAASDLLGGPRLVLASPLAIAAATWLALFVLRPLELYFYPAETITPLLQLGYDCGDLVRTVAIAGIGAATWALGFLLVLTLLRERLRELPALDPIGMRRRAPWVVLAMGACLAGVLFMRQGGVSALINSAGSLHTDQGSGFYGQIGIWMLVGVALYAFAVVVQGGRAATARRLLIVSAPLAVVSTLALGSRGFIVAGVLGACVIYLRLRAPRARTVIAALAVAVALGAVLEFTAVVRTNAASEDLGTAVELSAETPVAYFQTADLSAFDDFVVMQQLVPSSISWLEGESLLQIPAALAPRTLWPGKPEPLDSEVTAYLYPGATAGTPITLQGELYWNFGLAGVAIGALVLGALMGWSMLLLRRRDILSLLLYAVLYASVFALLTRAIGTMTANTVIALVGVGAAALAIEPRPLRALVVPLGRRASRIT